MLYIYVALAVIIRVFSNPLGNVFQKRLTLKGCHPLAVNFFTYLLLGIVCLFFITQYHWKDLPTVFWIWALVEGFIGALGNAFLVKALEKGDISILGPVNAYKSIVGMLIGIFLLREIPNIIGILGVAIIIYGSYYVMGTLPEGFSWKLFKRADIQYRIWAMILTGIEAVIIKKLIVYSSPAAAFMVWCWFGAIFAFILLYWRKISLQATISILRKNEILDFMLPAICMGLMQFTTNYVFKHMQVGYALSFFQLSIIVSVFLGYKIFKEDSIRQKLIGSVIMIVGAIIIIISQN